MCEKNNNVVEELTIGNINNDKLYSTAQIASLFGMSTAMICEYIKQGKLPAIYFGKLYKVQGKDLIKFINERKTKIIA